MNRKNSKDTLWQRCSELQGLNKSFRGLRVSIPAHFLVISMDDDRIVNIEIKLAHQEHSLSALNEALTNQQAQISKLEDLCHSLAERIRLLAASGGDDDGDERPPHY